MNKVVKIGVKEIGGSNPCFIIAEAGSNHNRSLSQAKKLIDVAVDAGADAVKFQLFKAENLYVKTAGNATYLKDSTSIYDIIKQMELPPEWIPELRDYSEENNILFLSSVTDESSTDVLEPFLPVYKIASYEITHLPLIRYAGLKKKPLILSTGASTMQEITDAVNEFENTGNKDLVLMHCIASYPAPLDQCNLLAIQTIADAFGIPVGWSDHTFDPVVSVKLATALGSKIFEKHFTLSKSLPGPDHKFALEPAELKEMVKTIRQTEELDEKQKQAILNDSRYKNILGSGEKTPMPIEQELREFARRFIYARKTVKKGEKLSHENIAVLRSGKEKHGLAPKYFTQVLGKPALADIKESEPITWEKIAR